MTRGLLLRRFPFSHIFSRYEDIWHFYTGKLQGFGRIGPGGGSADRPGGVRIRVELFIYQISSTQLRRASSTYFFHDLAYSRQHDNALSAIFLGGINNCLLEALSFYL